MKRAVLVIAALAQTGGALIPRTESHAGAFTKVISITPQILNPP